MTDMTLDQARERIARALYIAPRINPVDAAERWGRLGDGDDTRADYLDDAAAALSVLWPEIERLRWERDLARAEVVDAVALIERMAHKPLGLEAPNRDDGDPTEPRG